MLEHYGQLAQQRAAERAAAAFGAPPGTSLEELPDGVDLEEAAMLEAAMLGVPYTGRLPAFGRAGPSTGTSLGGAPPSPGAMEQRSLRAEQDAAYEESLALDRAKQQSFAAAQEAAQAQQRLEREAAAEAAAAAAAADQTRAAVLDTKRARLPMEPPGDEAGALSIVVRMPDGSRQGRRFRASDPLQAVFDFIDLAQDAQCSSGSAPLQPGAYRLVTQFPRRTYMDGSSESLESVGISSGSALFVEAL